MHSFRSVLKQTNIEHQANYVLVYRELYIESSISFVFDLVVRSKYIHIRHFRAATVQKKANCIHCSGQISVTNHTGTSFINFFVFKPKSKYYPSYLDYFRRRFSAYPQCD